METAISLPHSQVPATSPYPEHIDPVHAPLPPTKTLFRQTELYNVNGPRTYYHLSTLKY
jgi:hypothetical protein